MKLSEAWGNRNDASGTASSVARQLALSGIAVVWLLGGGLQASGVHLSRSLLAAGCAFIVVLFLDLLQYLVTTAVWAPWARSQEKRAQGYRRGSKRWKRANRRASKAWNKEHWKKDKVADGEDIGGAPDWFNWPTWLIFSLKMAVLVAGAVFLFMAFSHRLTIS